MTRKERAEGYTEGACVHRPAKAARPVFVSVVPPVAFQTVLARHALTSPSTQKLRIYN